MPQGNIFSLLREMPNFAIMNMFFGYESKFLSRQSKVPVAFNKNKKSYFSLLQNQTQ